MSRRSDWLLKSSEGVLYNYRALIAIRLAVAGVEQSHNKWILVVAPFQINEFYLIAAQVKRRVRVGVDYMFHTL